VFKKRTKNWNSERDEQMKSSSRKWKNNQPLTFPKIGSLKIFRMNLKVELNEAQS